MQFEGQRWETCGDFEFFAEVIHFKISEISRPWHVASLAIASFSSLSSPIATAQCLRVGCAKTRKLENVCICPALYGTSCYNAQRGLAAITRDQLLQCPERVSSNHRGPVAGLISCGPNFTATQPVVNLFLNSAKKLDFAALHFARQKCGGKGGKKVGGLHFTSTLGELVL